MKNYLPQMATIISYLGSPLVLIPLTFILVILRKVSGTESLIFLGVLVSIGVIPTVGFLFFLKKRGLISDWDINKRRERHVYNIFVLVLLIILLFMFYTHPLSGYVWMLLLWMSSFTAITFFWKISGHVGAATLCLYVLQYLHIVPAAAGTFIVFLIAWSRIYRKNHTFAQACAALVLSTFVYIAARTYNLL